MPVIEIIGATTIGIIIVAEFFAAIGIAITLFKLYEVSRRFNQGPQVHHHHYSEPRYDHEVDTHDEDEGGDEQEETPSQERPF